MSGSSQSNAQSAANRLHQYLEHTDVIDHQHDAIRALAAELAGDATQRIVVDRSFHWVRDNIRHSIDHGDRRVTAVASDVLRHGTGLCYAKSHLLAALLRANRIPCGFVYQRLAVDESATSFCLHGLNAVWLEEYGWYRIDARGNRDPISTAFDPPQEHLAFAVSLPGEATIDRVFAEPLPVVVSALLRYSDVNEFLLHLPDWQPE